MIRGVASKVMWVGRATVFFAGCAVILALVLRAASTASGTNGDFLKVGKSNLASAVSTLTKNGAGPALSLKVDSGPPLEVSSDAKVKKLNADKLDSQDPITVGREMSWAVINADGTVVRGKGLTTSAPGRIRKLATGHYNVVFDRDIRPCAYTATTDGGAGQTSVRTGGFAVDVEVFTVNSAGTPTDLPFHLIVTC